MGGIVVRYDKMNSWLKSPSMEVPHLANIMAARWAFEGLAVTHFIDNQFESMIYDEDQVIALADFKLRHYIPYLEQKTANCATSATLIYGELKKEELLTDLTAPNWEELCEKAGPYLLNLSHFYEKAYDQAIEKKEATLARLNPKVLLDKKMRHTNESLSGVLKGSFQKTKLKEVGHEIIPQLFPIYYLSPKREGLTFLYMPLYTPNKYLMGWSIPTFGFAVTCIWLMSAFLFALLYYDGLRQMLHLNTLPNRLIKVWTSLKLPRSVG
ncbi:MAG: hypothetical protein HC842_00120 [Cytophagales bacterium]|nr:hypothetical protein [Cytophagales bacterium]